MIVPEHVIFRATAGLALKAPVARTLSHCLFWSQHASYWDGKYPSIWKTGPQLELELRIDARTANRHLKALAGLGYWDISYRPRPGTIGRVSWLTFTTKAMALLETAKALAAERQTKKVTKVTLDEHELDHPIDAENVDASVQNVTIKKPLPTGKTTGANNSFILPSETGKQGMNEAPFDHSPGKEGKCAPKAPGYAKASTADHELAAVIEAAWSGAGLKSWDWTSVYTWRHVAEVRRKLAELGIATGGEISAFVASLLENWHWLRITMANRYAFHETNTHAPSPMALAHEFQIISSKLLEKIKGPPPKPKSTNLDDDDL